MTTVEFIVSSVICNFWVKEGQVLVCVRACMCVGVVAFEPLLYSFHGDYL